MASAVLHKDWEWGGLIFTDMGEKYLNLTI